MKKLILIILLLLIFPFNAFANEKIDVKYSSCVDGDTAKFIINNKIEKVRFLAIDTPETKHPTKGEEPYGKEASMYTCTKIKNAKKIQLEFDDKSTKTDKYGRYLAWVYVDDNLLQAELVKKGLAKVAYLYGDYRYNDLLKEYETTAKLNKVGMYSDVDNSYYTKNKKGKKVSNKDEKYITKLIERILANILNEILK